MVDVQATIYKPFYDIEGRKYIDLEFENKIVRVKVPFRYNRVMCHVLGLKTIQEFVKGDHVIAFIEDKKWGSDLFPVLISIRENHN